MKNLTLAILIISWGIFSQATANSLINSRAELSKDPHLSGVLRQIYNKRAQQAIKSMNKRRSSNSIKFLECEEEGPTCTSAACNTGGIYCGSSSGLEKVLRLCKGVSGECVKDGCDVGGIYCGSSSGLEKVLQLCKGSRGSCVRDSCATGGIYCGSSSGLEKVILLCKGVPSGCVKEACDFGGIYCGSSSGLEKVLQLCSEN